MIYVFDVDGTLTDPRQPMNPEFKFAFSKFCDTHKVVLVSGSDFEKIEEQVSEITKLAKTVYGCSGSSKYEKVLLDVGGDWGWIATHRSFDKPEGLIEELEKILENSKYEYRFGTHIEDRGSMINFSVVGRDANYEDRIDYNKWDYNNHERDMICARIYDMYDGEIECVKGGQISVDIYPKGWDKSQILKDLDEPVHFFGDKIQEGGNDHEIAMAVLKQGGTVSSVKSWRDTWEILKEIN